MVLTKIYRLKHLNDNSLDENISLSAGLLAEINKREQFIKIGERLHLLCLGGVCLFIGVLLLLMCLCEVGLAMPPFIHAVEAMDLDLHDPLFLRIVRSMAAAVLLPFLLNLVLAVVECFVPTKAEHINGNSLEEKLNCLGANLEQIRTCRVWGREDCGDDATGQSIICTAVCGLPILIGVGVWIVSNAVNGESGERDFMSFIGQLVALVIGSLILVSLCFGICWIYFYVCGIYLYVLFGNSYAQKHILIVGSVYVGYKEQILVSAMSPSEQREYFRQKKAEKERREREYREYRERHAVYNSYNSTSGNAGDSFFNGTSPTLTSRDHDDLDMLQNMADQNISDGI